MANIKELLASMIGKINGKLNAPEQAAQPYQQLVTDADGVAKWEDRLTTEEITQFPVNFTFKAGTKYLYDIVLTPEDIVFGEEYNFKIAPNGEHAIGGYTYRAVDEFIVSAIAQESSDREGNPAVKFEFSDVKMVQSFAGDIMAGYDLTLNSITFRKDNVFVSISEHNAGLMSSNEFTIQIETDMFHEHKIIKIDPEYLPEIGGGFMRIDISANEDESEYYANVSGVAITEALNNGIMPYCVIAGMVVPLQSSPALSPVSVMTAAPMHEFSSIQINGTGNSFVLICEIDMVETDAPCRVNITQYFIASDVLELA